MNKSSYRASLFQSRFATSLHEYSLHEAYERLIPRGAPHSPCRYDPTSTLCCLASLVLPRCSSIEKNGFPPLFTRRNYRRGSRTFHGASMHGSCPFGGGLE